MRRFRPGCGRRPRSLFQSPGGPWRSLLIKIGLRVALGEEKPAAKAVASTGSFSTIAPRQEPSRLFWSCTNALLASGGGIPIVLTEEPRTRKTRPRARGTGEIVITIEARGGQKVPNSRFDTDRRNDVANSQNKIRSVAQDRALYVCANQEARRDGSYAITSLGRSPENPLRRRDAHRPGRGRGPGAFPRPPATRPRLKRFWRAHAPMVLGICRRWLNDPHDVDDAASSCLPDSRQERGHCSCSKQPLKLALWRFTASRQACR